jgi:SulP family sulfate permease
MTSQHDKRETLRRDLFAGLTVALFALPQAIAYALLAGIQPQYGLYAFMVSTVVGSFFGSSRHLQTGPTNATAIVVASVLASYVHDDKFMGVVLLLTFLAGALRLAAGLLRWGTLTHFISRPVLEGFIAGAGLSIVINQLPNLLGIPGSTQPSILEAAAHVISGAHQLQPLAVTVSMGTIAAVLLLNRIIPKSPSGVPYVPTYLITLLLAAGAAAFWKLDERGVRVLGELPGAFPPLSLPLVDASLARALLPGAFAVALIGVAESISIAKSVAAFSGDRVDANRELVGQGLANMGVAFFSGMPVSGSLTRTMLSYQTGAVTKLGNISAALFFLLAVLVLHPLVRSIPIAALAGILIVVAFNMVNWRSVHMVMRTTRSDAITMVATFASAFIFPLDYALYVGVGVSLVLFLRKAQMPQVQELVYDAASGFHERDASLERATPEIAILHIEGNVFFGAADLVEEKIAHVARQENLHVVILRIKRAGTIDATFLLAIQKLAEEMIKRDKMLLISGVTGDVETIFRRSGFDRIIGRENIFYSDATILNSTRQALARAMEHVNAKVGTHYEMGS